jgi:hypothetical protein
VLHHDLLEASGKIARAAATNCVRSVSMSISFHTAHRVT